MKKLFSFIFAMSFAGITFAQANTANTTPNELTAADIDKAIQAFLFKAQRTDENVIQSQVIDAAIAYIQTTGSVPPLECCIHKSLLHQFIKLAFMPHAAKQQYCRQLKTAAEQQREKDAAIPVAAHITGHVQAIMDLQTQLQTERQQHQLTLHQERILRAKANMQIKQLEEQLNGESPSTYQELQNAIEEKEKKIADLTLEHQQRLAALQENLNAERSMHAKNAVAAAAIKLTMEEQKEIIANLEQQLRKRQVELKQKHVQHAKAHQYVKAAEAQFQQESAALNQQIKQREAEIVATSKMWEEKVAAIQQQHKNTSRAIQELQGKLEEKEHQIADITKQAKDVELEHQQRSTALQENLNTERSLHAKTVAAAAATRRTSDEQKKTIANLEQELRDHVIEQKQNNATQAKTNLRTKEIEAQLTGEITTLNQQLKQSRTNAIAWENKTAATQSLLTAREQQIADLTQKANAIDLEHQQQLATLQNDLDAERGQHAKKVAAYEALKNSSDEQKKTIANREQELRKTHVELKQEHVQHAKANQRIKTLESQFNDETNSFKQRVTDELQTKLTHVNRQWEEKLAATQRQHENAYQTINDLRSNIEDEKRQAEEYQQQIAMLQHKIDTEQRLHSQALNKQMQQHAQVEKRLALVHSQLKKDHLAFKDATQYEMDQLKRQLTEERMALARANKKIQDLKS